MLALVPFEPPLSEAAGIPVTYVGHPMAAHAASHWSRRTMRERLKLGLATPVFALLPVVLLLDVKNWGVIVACYATILVGVFTSWRHIRTGHPSVPVVLGITFVLAILFTRIASPFVLTPLYAVLKYLIYRIDVMVPAYLLPAFFVASWKPHGARVTKVVVLVALMVAVIPILRQNAFTPEVLASERRNGPDRWARGLYQIAQQLRAILVK